MADEIRAEYERLQQVAAQFSRQAVAIAQMQQRVQRCMGALRGAWQGQGSTAFFAEMENELLPAVQRLAQALSQAGRVTQQIDALLRAAEEDASRPFRGGEAAVSAGGSGGAGSGGSGGGTGDGQGEPTGGAAGDSGRVFTDQYLTDAIGRQIQGAGSQALNSAMETLAGNPTPEQVRRALDQIAAARGIPREQIQADYERYLALRDEAARIGGANGKAPIDPVNQTFHDRFMGSLSQMRYGQVVGDALGVDPVFGALLNPTGGLVGPDNYAVDLDDSAVGYHGVFHDAAGYLYNYHDLGPGYNYLGREDRDTGNPLTGQESGIRYWNEKMGNDGVSAVISDAAGVGLGKLEDARVWVSERIDDVRDGAGRIRDWFGDLFGD